MRSGVVIASKYRIVRQLGAGGMGSVWHAVHQATERDFAIKFLHAALAKNTALLARFFQEAKVSGKLRHPSIIEIFDVGSAVELEDSPFLVMELLDGASLDVLMRRTNEPIPMRIALESMAEISRALALAHDKGIVHRDLKPANIFLHRPGTGAIVPKVLDFGISKFSGSAAPDIHTGLTQTGAVLGSPLYMSPEQAASDKSIDGRSDVHALGVVLWECLVGKPPFVADTYNNLVVQIITGERPRLGEVMPDVPRGVAAIVDRAMQRKREDRFASASELAEALEAEIAKLMPSTSITSRAAAAEVFARMPATSVRPPSNEGVEEEGMTQAPAGTTTGGMSVPSVRRPASSPAAFTMQDPRPKSSSETAFAATQIASSEPGSSAPFPATLASAGTPPGASSSATTPRRTTGIAAGAGAAIVLAGVLGMVAMRRPATTAGAAPIATEPAVSPLPPIAAASSVAPAPSAPTSAAPPPAASSAVVTTSPPATAARPAAIAPAAPRKTTPTKKSEDSVQSSGF
jgi:serine/threonine-protein kinase